MPAPACAGPAPSWPVKPAADKPRLGGTWCLFETFRMAADIARHAVCLACIIVAAQLTSPEWIFANLPNGAADLTGFMEHGLT